MRRGGSEGKQSFLFVFSTMWLNGNSTDAVFQCCLYSIYLFLGLKSVELAEEEIKHDSLTDHRNSLLVFPQIPSSQ